LQQPLQSALSGISDAFVTKISTAPPACQLPAPVPLSPGGGIFDPAPQFSWQTVPGAEAYAVVIKSVAQSVLSGTPNYFVLGTTTDTSLPSPGVLPSGDFEWLVVPWNASCGTGRPSSGMTFTLPGSCPVGQAVNLTPGGGTTVPNPTQLTWTVDGSSVTTLSIVIILRFDGSVVGIYPTASNNFTIPATLSMGDYAWFVLTWNSTCGVTWSAPQTFRSSGGVVP
jgi:hypothetical protein